MVQPKVSIIVPCWGVEKYLDRCVKSLVSQTLQDIEIILVDDVSPDKVPEMCDEWAKKDSRIKVIHKVQNEGLGMACNTGIDAATGEYIAFCDSDDWVESDMYKTMYDTAKEHDSEIVYTGLNRIDSHGHKDQFPHPKEKIILKGKSQVNNLILSMIASSPSDPIERHIAMSAKVVLYSLKLIKHYHVRFESERKFISEDLLFNIDNLIHTESVVVLPCHFYNYLFNAQSLTSRVRGDRFEKNLILRKELLRRYIRQEMPEEFKTRINRMFLGYARTDIMLLCKSTCMPIKERYKLFCEISTHPIWKQMKELFPIKQMPTTHRIIFECIKNRLFFPLLLISKFK